MDWAAQVDPSEEVTTLQFVPTATKVELPKATPFRVSLPAFEVCDAQLSP